MQLSQEEVEPLWRDFSAAWLTIPTDLRGFFFIPFMPWILFFSQSFFELLFFLWAGVVKVEEYCKGFSKHRSSLQMSRVVNVDC